MKSTKFLITVVLFALTSAGYAQKGMGNNSGIASSNSADEIEQISGEIREIITEPCTQTTGRYSTGTHLLVKNGNNETLNVHLGPTNVVSGMTDQLNAGDEIHLEMYTTDDLPENHYIVKEFRSKGETYEIRNSNLKPFWANSNSSRRGRKR